MKLSNSARTLGAILALISTSILFVMMWGLNIEAGTLGCLFDGFDMLLHGKLNSFVDVAALVFIAAFSCIGIYFRKIGEKAFQFLTDPANF